MSNHQSVSIDIQESGFTLMLILLLLGIIPVVSIGSRGQLVPAAFVGALLVLIGLAFRSIRIFTQDGRLKVLLGGLFTVQNVALTDIVAVEQTKFSALAGLGIRWTPRGTLYAVNFGSAVEVRLRSGTSFFVNLKEPNALVEPLSRAIGAG